MSIGTVLNADNLFSSLSPSSSSSWEREHASSALGTLRDGGTRWGRVIARLNAGFPGGLWEWVWLRGPEKGVVGGHLCRGLSWKCGRVGENAD